MTTNGPSDIPIVATADTAQAVGAMGKLNTTLDATAASVGNADAALGSLTETLAAIDGETVAAADSTGRFSKTIQTATGELTVYGNTLREVNVAAEQALATADMQAAATERLTAAYVDNSVAAGVASKNLSPMFRGLTRMETMGTPAILKTATWTLLGVGGIAYEGIKNYMNFQKSITQSITQAGVSPSRMPFLTNLAENVSKMTGINLSDVSNSIYRIASGTASWNNGLGATNKQLTQIVTQISHLQVLGDVGTGAISEQTSRVITAMINTGLSDIGGSAKKAAMLFNAVIGSGDMRAADLVPGIGRGLLVSARANGMSGKDALAWTALLTSKGTTASVAGNYVKTGINLLANPSAQGVAALAMLGIRPGEMQGIIRSPGGLSEALRVLVAHLKKFQPGNIALYRDKIGNVRPGGAGLGAAINKLETWTVGELPKSFIQKWEQGKLSAKQQAYATDLIMTKAFGGSKQFATLAAIISDPNKFYAVEAAIARKDNPAYYNKSVQIALNTPYQRFHKVLTQLQVDLVKIGKVMYPVVIALADGFAKFFNVLTTFKPLLFSLITPLAAILGAATVSKVGAIGTGIYRMIGGALGMHGKMSSFLYKHGYTSFGKYAPQYLNKELGTIATNSEGQMLAMDGSVLSGRSARYSYQMAANDAMVKLGTGLATNTGAVERLTAVETDLARISAGSSPVGPLSGLGGRGGVRTIESEAQKIEAATASTSRTKLLPLVGRDPKTGRFFSLGNSKSVIAYDASIRAMGSDAIEATAGSSAIALSGLEAGAITSAVGEGALGTAGAGIVSGLGGGLSGLVGGLGSFLTGPIGMMLAMTAGPALLSMAAPAISSAFHSITGWLFGGNNKPIYGPHIGGVATSGSIKARVTSLRAQLKAMHFNYSNATRAEYLQHDKLTTELNKALGLSKYFGKHPLAGYSGAQSTLNDVGLKQALKASSKGALLPGMLRGYDGMITSSSETKALSVKYFRSLLPKMQGRERRVLSSMIDEYAKGTGPLAGASPVQFQHLVHSTLLAVKGRAYNALGDLAVFATSGLSTSTLLHDKENLLGTYGTISGQANFGNLNQLLTYRGLNKSDYSARESDVHKDITSFLKIAKEDLAASKNTKLDTGSRILYREAAKKAQKEAAEFAIFAQGMKDKMGHMKLHSQSVQELSKSVSAELKTVYVDLGMNQSGMKTAFAEALNSSGKALANIVNRENANAAAKGNKVGG